MSDPIPEARLRELATVAGDRNGGVLLDVAFVRELATELLVSRAELAATNKAWDAQLDQGELRASERMARQREAADALAAARADRDAAVARCTALAGAVDDYRGAVDAMGNVARAGHRPGTPVYEAASAAVVERRAALDALLTEEVGDGR